MVAEDARIAGNAIKYASVHQSLMEGKLQFRFLMLIEKVILTKVYVPIKFIQLTSNSSIANKSLLEAISRFSNTQSKVNDADRMVNMAPHPELQEVSQKSGYSLMAVAGITERRRGEIRTKN